MNESCVSVTMESLLLEHVVEFPEGLPGFRGLRRFVFRQKASEKPYAWMASVDEPGLAFAVAEAHALAPEFSFEVSDEELECIGSPGPAECGLWFIVKMDAAGRPAQANCSAPVVVNLLTRQAKQVIVQHERQTPSVLTIGGV